MTSIPARGRMAVDFEQRVDFDRLREYRLQRTRDALEASGLGAILLFDMHNVRYVSSTHLGEWARDKMTRFVLLTRTGEPYVWDFGSAARHHQLYCPWLADGHARAGLGGLRGAIPPHAELFELAAAEIRDILVEEGVADLPVG